MRIISVFAILFSINVFADEMPRVVTFTCLNAESHVKVHHIGCAGYYRFQHNGVTVVNEDVSCDKSDEMEFFVQDDLDGAKTFALNGIRVNNKNYMLGVKNFVLDSEKDGYKNYTATAELLILQSGPNEAIEGLQCTVEDSAQN